MFAHLLHFRLTPLHDFIYVGHKLNIIPINDMKHHLLYPGLTVFGKG